MATFTELKAFIKTIKADTTLSVDGKQMTGQRLKNYLISKLSNPSQVEIEKPEPKAKAKKDKDTNIQEPIKTE